jgi:hypothetical protein
MYMIFYFVKGKYLMVDGTGMEQNGGVRISMKMRLPVETGEMVKPNYDYTLMCTTLTVPNLLSLSKLWYSKELLKEKKVKVFGSLKGEKLLSIAPSRCVYSKIKNHFNIE